MQYFYCEDSDNHGHAHTNVRFNHVTKNFDVHVDTVLYEGTPAIIYVGSYKVFDEAMLKWRESDTLLKERNKQKKLNDIDELICLMNYDIIRRPGQMFKGLNREL
jgi:hypothetical protein